MIGSKMNWKEVLSQLEYKKDWDTAIEYMQHVIQENPEEMDAYIYMNYLLMNLLVEEDHSDLNHDLNYYAQLAKNYFDISYAKYSNNAEYLFYTAKTAFMSEWYFGIELEEAEAMLQKAAKLEPNNILYQEAFLEKGYYQNLEARKKARPYAKIVLEENSPIKALLLTKGALGKYLLEITTNWALNMLSDKYL